MIKRHVSKTLKNKNIIMLLTTIIYIFGCFTSFHNHIIESSLLLTILAIICTAKEYIKPKLIILWLLIFYFAVVNASIQTKTNDSLLNYAPEKCSITGQIKTIPNSSKENKLQFFFKVDKININGKTIDNIDSNTFVTINHIANQNNLLKIGNYYVIKGALKRPFKAGNPAQFDYSKYLSNYDTTTIFYAESYDVKEIPHEKTLKTKFIQSLNDLRDRILTTHSKYLKSPNLEILGGIVFGDDAVAPPDTIRNSFINSGLLHILAASGMNVAFIYGFWYFALRKLRVPFKITLISGIFIVLLYSLMTGLGASVIRATFMLIFILIGKLIDRDAHSIALLSMVALIMLIFNPSYINEVSFQLSFLVTLGLLTTANTLFSKVKKLPAWLTGAILIPIVAQIWVIPVQMFYFNTISLYSVFANILTVPFLSIVSFLGFSSSILAIFEPFTSYLCKYSDFILNHLLNIIVYISNMFASLPHSLIDTFQPTHVQIPLYYIFILMISYLIHINFKSKKLIIHALVILLLMPIVSIKIPSKNMELITFDVQNADAFLLKSPQNKYFIIDTGRSSYKKHKTQAEKIILKYLQTQNINEIEGLIITHFDTDHAGGATKLIEKLNIKNVYVNSLNNPSKISQEIYNATDEHHNHIIVAKNNEVIFKENDFSIKTLRKSHATSDNESSIITLVSDKNINILMMGDASLENINNLPHKVNILKVGHHGAKSVINTNTLKSINPDISIISTGPNQFGHPNILTLKQLKDTKIFRTDKNNSIKIESNGDNYTVSTFNIEKKEYVLKDKI